MKEFSVEGVLRKEKNETISEKEFDQFIDDFCDFAESKGYLFCGGWKPVKQ